MSEFSTITGKSLLGLKYKPLFPFFKGTKNAFQVIAGSFVNTEDGTGIVHVAPGFGEDDNIACKANNIPVVCPVDEGGCFDSTMQDIKYNLAGKEQILSLSGLQVFESNDHIIKYLKSKDVWLKTEEYTHNYPHCWRTDVPLIYKAVKSWYVQVTAIKDRMIELNKQINWIPSHVRDGMFGKWLENTRDWSISRNRFWGCPVPVWISNDPRYPRTEVYGSLKELEDAFGDHYEKSTGKKLKVTDLHRPFVDSLTRPNQNDPTGQSMMVRITDVLDCWFESGSMPFASIHYPFEYKIGDSIIRTASENQVWFEQHFPSDFIVEYMAQTRGWFYTLMVMGTALFDKAPFRNCICHGVVLDENSQKLSKRLRNYPDPMEMFNTYGSDAMRFAMMKSGVMSGREINIDKGGKFIRDTYRSVVVALWNSFTFLKTYMEADGLWSVSNKYNAFFQIQPLSEMDKYIFSELHLFIKMVQESLDNYDTPIACNAIVEFIDTMNNWYIRLNRKRFGPGARLVGREYQFAIKFAEKVTMLDVKTLERLHVQIEECLTSIKKDSFNFDVNNIELQIAAIVNLSTDELMKSLSDSDERKTESQVNLSDCGITIMRRLEILLAIVQSVHMKTNIIQNDVFHMENFCLKIDYNKEEIIVINNDRLSAYCTLYTTLLLCVRTVAPLLPCLAEKIYLELTNTH